ncbi:MAG: MetQ/NlpA family ABC transporter substrate-binding protein [Staphylococcus equorum]|nr:MetQ/NlpA family ABC transporter substrate-binding protein [Staphylococcus equorum]
MTDGVQLNKATAQGNVDVNAFQSWSYYLALELLFSFGVII